VNGSSPFFVPGTSTQAVIVLFDDEFRVWRSAMLTAAQLEAESRFVEHVKGYRVMATDALLDQGEDWTDRLRTAAKS
jgi:hypothetical protein